MKKVPELVQRIESHYVCDDCVQIMISYNNEMTVFNKRGIVFSHNLGEDIAINKYLEDERRNRFPYSNIPIHHEKTGLFGKIYKVNQLLDFEVPYISVGDGCIIERYAVKDKNEALLVKKVMSGTKKTSYITRKELEQLYTESEKKFILHLKDFGEVTRKSSNLELFSGEERICDYIEKEIVKSVKDFREYAKNFPTSTVGSYLLKHPSFLDFVEQSTNNLDLTNMRFNIPLNGSKAIMVSIDQDDMLIQFVETSFVSINNYRIDSIDLPVNKYTLKQLKDISSSTILKLKEPKIPLRLNHGVTKQDIQKAKQMVKTKKRLISDC